MNLARIQDHLAGLGWEVYLSGEVPLEAACPYLLLYSLTPRNERPLARAPSARQERFGVTVVDLGSAHIESEADAVEAALEGSRILHPSSRIELISRGPVIRDSEVVIDGAELHTLPLHWTATIPKETT